MAVSPISSSAVASGRCTPTTGPNTSRSLSHMKLAGASVVSGGGSVGAVNIVDAPPAPIARASTPSRLADGSNKMAFDAYGSTTSTTNLGLRIANRPSIGNGTPASATSGGASPASCRPTSTQGGNRSTIGSKVRAVDSHSRPSEIGQKGGRPMGLYERYILKRPNATARELLLSAPENCVRKVEGLPVYGAPPPEGFIVREVARQISADVGRSEHSPCTNILWLDARAQPTIYVNGQPCYLDERESLGCSNSLVSSGDLLADDTTLKSEVLSEAALREGRVQLYETVDSSKAASRSSWEILSDVLTPREAYSKFEHAVMGLCLKHVSMNDNATDSIIAELASFSSKGLRPLVVCSVPLGNESFLTGMLATLALIWPHMEQGSTIREERIVLTPWYDEEPAAIGALVAMLKNGEALRAWVDHCLSLCRRPPTTPSVAVNVGIPSFLRLLMLAAYLQEQSLRPLDSFVSTFQTWFQAEAERIGVCDLLAPQLALGS